MSKHDNKPNRTDRQPFSHKYILQNPPRPSPPPFHHNTLKIFNLYIDGWMDAINVGNFRRRILATSGPDKVHHNRIMKPPWMSRMLPLVRGWFSPNIGGFWAHFRVVYLIHGRGKGRHIHVDYDVVVACHPRATF